MKLIIAGSRSFKDYEMLKAETMYFILRTISPFDNDIEIISGKAIGADLLGERFATEYNLKLIEMPADWDRFGKSAGYIRNKQMAEIATHCICFWDGESKGTKHMIDLAEQFNLIMKIIRY